jgi:phage gp16-like protein
MIFDTRKSLLAKIHIAKKQLGLDDATYRSILARFRVESSRDLDAKGLEKLVDHMARLGAEFTSATPKAKPGYQARPAQRRSEFYEIPDGPRAKVKRYIAAMWRELGYDMVSLDTRVQREFAVDAFRWLEDEQGLHRLLTDLEKRLKAKDRAKAQADDEAGAAQA